MHQRGSRFHAATDDYHYNCQANDDADGASLSSCFYFHDNDGRDALAIESNSAGEFNAAIDSRLRSAKPTQACLASSLMINHRRFPATA